MIDKTLLLTVRRIGTQFSNVKEQFLSKIRGGETVCGSAAVFLEPSAHHYLGASLVGKQFEAHFGQTHPARLLFKMSSLVDNGVKSSIFDDVYVLLLTRIESPHHLKNNPSKTARFKRLYATKKAKGFRLLGDLPTGVIPI